MAAAIAASLPTVQAAPAPVAPTYEAIPPSMSKVIDIEADISISSVQLDALVSSFNLLKAKGLYTKYLLPRSFRKLRSKAASLHLRLHSGS